MFFGLNPTILPYPLRPIKKDLYLVTDIEEKAVDCDFAISNAMAKRAVIIIFIFCY